MMNITAKLTFNGNQVQLSGAELVQLQEAITFALGGGKSTARTGRFGVIQVERLPSLGPNVKTFGKGNQEPAADQQTDC